MESRFRVLFLIIAMIGLSGCAATKNLFGFGREEAPPPSAEPPGQVIDPEVERRRIKEPKIDKENFELGAYALRPDLKVIAPWREWNLRGRADCVAYAETHGIPWRGISGASPELEALARPRMDRDELPFDPLEYIERLDELPFDPDMDPSLGN